MVHHQPIVTELYMYSIITLSTYECERTINKCTGVYCLRQVDLLLRRLVQIGILSGYSTGPNKQVLYDERIYSSRGSTGRAGGCTFIA